MARETRDFAPGDRLIFTQNDSDLGVANGSVGSIERIEINPANGALLLWSSWTIRRRTGARPSPFQPP